jgi:hypothetical protein
LSKAGIPIQADRRFWFGNLPQFQWYMFSTALVMRMKSQGQSQTTTNLIFRIYLLPFLEALTHSMPTNSYFSDDIIEEIKNVSIFTTQNCQNLTDRGH